MDDLELRLFLSSTRQAIRPVVKHGNPATTIDAIVVKRSPVTRYATGHRTAPAGSSGPVGLIPSQITTAYGLNNVVYKNSSGTTLALGSGQTIAIIDAYYTPTIVNDLHQFDLQFGLADPTFTAIDQNGNAITSTNHPTVDPNTGGGATWELETALDVEWAHAMAPGANILLVECDDSSLDSLSSGASLSAARGGVSVVSMSFGAPEFFDENAYDSSFATPSGHQGVTFVAATGDKGSPATYPSYAPNVVAVGGTTLTLNSDNTYSSETAWSGSGGGISAYESQPTYQNGVVTQSTTMRTAPDVSMDADPSSGVTIYDSYDNGSLPWAQIGGTSLAAPLFAGVVAIANQGRVLQNLGTLDGATQTLPKLYAAPASTIHDITSGNNGGFNATTGYDLVTGVGSVVGDKFINYLAPAATVGSVTLPTGANTVTVKRDADNLHADITVTNSTGTTTIQPLLSQGTAYSISGGTADTITFDFSAGDPLPTSGATVNASSGANTIRIVGTTGNDGVTVGPSSMTVSGGVASLPGGVFSNVPIATTNVQAVNLPGGSGGSDTITFNGATRQTNDDTASGTANVTVNVLAGAAVTFTAPQHLAALTVNNASAVLPAVAAQVVIGGALTLSNGGKLDLTSGQLLLNTAATSAATVRGYIATGYNGGSWTGAGLYSSTAAASPTTGALGYALPGDSTSASVATGTLLVKLTTPADADLSGATTFTDFMALQNNFGVAGDWSQGDFDYNGVVNFADFMILQNAINH